MSKLSIHELEEVAEAYGQLLAPALFEAWTPRIADAAEIRSGQSVLDVACGTGVLARTVAERVGFSGSVSGVDINPGMLAVAERISSGIDWREGSAEALPYDDGAFDAVVSQFGLMLFSSPESSLREMSRVLKRDGHLAVAVFDSIENLPAYSAMSDVFERVVGKSVGDALRVPFSMGDTKKLDSLCVAAGLSTAMITTKEDMAHFSSVKSMVLSDVRGWFPFAGIHLDDNRIEAVVNQAEEVLKPFLSSDGAVEFKVPVHILTWKKQ